MMFLRIAGRQDNLPRGGGAMSCACWAPLCCLVALALLAGGCSSGPKGTQVTFVADPAPAQMRVERLPVPGAAQGEIVARGASPLSTRLDLASGNSWRLVAEPSTEAGRESYQTTEVRYDRAGLLAAAGASARPADGRDGGNVDPGALRVPVEMKLRESVPLPALLPAYHPREGWLAVRTRVRAYHALVEADGTAPEQIASLSALSAVGAPDRLGTDIGVWGLDVSDVDGGRIITSVFRPAANGIDIAATDPEAALRLARIPRPEDRARAMLHSLYRFAITSADLISLRLSGQAEVRLTADGHVNLTPAFAPDGQHVYFASNRDQRSTSDIYRRPSLRAGALDVVTRNLPEGGAAWPSQAKGGTIAFAFLPETASVPDTGHIYAKIGGLGGYDSLIVNGGTDPRISPDGEMLAYVARSDLWVCSVDGSQQRRLTTDGAAILDAFAERSLSNAEDEKRFDQFEKQWVFAPYRDPAFSPDGRRLVYASLAGTDSEGRPNYDIWLLDLDTSRTFQITTNGSMDVLPRFDPAGQFIYFLSNRGRQWAIWRLPTPESEMGGQ